MSDDGRLYESREVAEILGVPPGQIAKWKHEERAAPVRFARRSGHHIPLWELRAFTGPNFTKGADGKPLIVEYRENREKMLARRARNT